MHVICTAASAAFLACANPRHKLIKYKYLVSLPLKPPWTLGPLLTQEATIIYYIQHIMTIPTLYTHRLEIPVQLKNIPTVPYKKLMNVLREL